MALSTRHFNNKCQMTLLYRLARCLTAQSARWRLQEGEQRPALSGSQGFRKLGHGIPENGLKLPTRELESPPGLGQSDSPSFGDPRIDRHSGGTNQIGSHVCAEHVIGFQAGLPESQAARQ